MRRFKFRLEAVLHHREMLESQREQEFATAQGVLQVIQDKVDALQAEFRRISSERTGSRPGERLDAHIELDRERYLRALHLALEEQKRYLEDVRVIVEERRQALVHARQAREAVSRLREKDLQAHTALNLKIEQDTLDEQATIRYVRQSYSNPEHLIPPETTTEEAA